MGLLVYRVVVARIGSGETTEVMTFLAESEDMARRSAEDAIRQSDNPDILRITNIYAHGLMR
jgi:hypothetical protein